MGRILQLLINAAGEAGLSSALGRWRQAVSEAIDNNSGTIEVLDEGASQGEFTKLNFVGAGVLAAPGAPGEADIIIPGGGGGGTAAVLSSVYSCPAGVAVNDAVYVSGANAVDQADADDPTKQPLIGIVQSKPSAVTCIVAYYGEVSGFVGLAPNATYYLSATPGLITTTAPSTPGNIVQRVGFARSTTVFVVMADRDFTEIT